MKNLGVLDPAEAPPESAAIETDGYTVLRGVFSTDEVAILRAEIEASFAERSSERNRTDRDEFRYQMLNYSAACQRALAHPRVLAVIEPLLGDDCHVIANTAWRNPPDHKGGPWHCDAGPHVPRPEGVPWDDRIPYPVFAIGGHFYLQDCREEDGPTAIIPGSHRSGRLAPAARMMDPDLDYDGRPPFHVIAKAGDVALFSSDCWHRGSPGGPGAQGRFFLQVHYGRRDIAQRLVPTSEVNQLTPEAVRRAQTDREKAVVGLHAPFFYDG